MDDEKRPITAEDVYRVTYVEDPRISPDGKWIAYIHRSLDKKENDYKTHIWVVPTDGGKPVQLTRSGQDTQPRWSPDGSTLAFTSTRQEKSQIYLLPITAPGGEPRVLTRAQNGVTDPAWSPDGRHIAYLAKMNAEERAREDSGEEERPPEDSFEERQRKELNDHEEGKCQDPRLVWRVPYRVLTSYIDDRYKQIYVIPVDKDLESKDAKPRRLTNIDADYEPPEWTPDGRFIIAVRTVDPAADEPSRLWSLFRIKVEDSTEEQLTDESHLDSVPRPSPDGRWIAYTRVSGGKYHPVPRLAVIPADGGEPHDLTLDLDRTVTFYRWSPDGGHLIVTADNEGNGEVYRVTLNGESTKIIPGTMHAEALDISPDGGIAFTASTPCNPSELFWQPLGAEEPLQLTDANTKFLEEVTIQETYELRWKAPDGTPIQGWYILPDGYEEGKTYPLAFNIHGGPHVMWSSSQRSMWHEWQFHAARGYVVFYCNPRGADGYGSEFRDAIHAAWGTNDMPDLMAGIDTLLELGFVDETRMTVTGGSYGGFQTAWVIGHTDRFVAAVSQRGVYNLSSFYGTSDIPSLISDEFDVEPWEDHQKLWGSSPLAYAQWIKTPLLLIHSENDFRVPIEQAEQLFAFVRRSGGTVELWRYPRDGHELSRSGEPEHRLSRLTRMVEWFDKYCMPEKHKAQTET